VNVKILQSFKDQSVNVSLKKELILNCLKLVVSNSNLTMSTT